MYDEHFGCMQMYNIKIPYGRQKGKSPYFNGFYFFVNYFLPYRLTFKI